MLIMILILIIAVLLLITLYLYLKRCNTTQSNAVIETVKVTDMKIESKAETTIKLDLEPLTKPTDYDTMVGKM